MKDIVAVSCDNKIVNTNQYACQSLYLLQSNKLFIQYLTEDLDGKTTKLTGFTINILGKKYDYEKKNF